MAPKAAQTAAKTRKALSRAANKQLPAVEENAATSKSTNTVKKTTGGPKIPKTKVVKTTTRTTITAKATEASVKANSSVKRVADTDAPNSKAKASQLTVKTTTPAKKGRLS